jgi:hypothetical protein
VPERVSECARKVQLDVGAAVGGWTENKRLQEMHLNTGWDTSAGFIYLPHARYGNGLRVEESNVEGMVDALASKRV